MTLAIIAPGGAFVIIFRTRGGAYPMFYDAIKNEHGMKHDPFKAMIVPRPIGWISSLAPDGIVNLAPYSFFNAVSDKPHILVFSSTGYKDNIRNIDQTGEFVFNLATFDLKDQMNTTSAMVAPDVDEFQLSGLTPAPSRMVAPPRVAESPVAMECKHLQTIELMDIDGKPSGSWAVFGQVVGIHIDDSLIAGGRVHIEKAKPIARLGYMDYAVVEDVFALPRPAVNADGSVAAE